MMFVFERPAAGVLAALAVSLIGVVMAGERTNPAREVSTTSDAARVAALDVQYQAAVERNDATTMATILHPDFVLRLGDGRRFTREDLLRSARERDADYEHQVEDPDTQSVIVHGDTAIVTARLWSKGTHGGRPFEHRLWFSDTYVKTPGGWRYLFGQASLPLPP